MATPSVVVAISQLLGGLSRKASRWQVQNFAQERCGLATHGIPSFSEKGWVYMLLTHVLSYARTPPQKINVIEPLPTYTSFQFLALWYAVRRTSVE
jgi:hypothetical protein